MAYFNLTTIIGETYRLTNPTDDIIYCLNNYNYVVFVSGGSNYICFFDNEVEWFSDDNYRTVNYGSKNNIFKTFIYDSSSVSWSEKLDNSISFPNYYNILCCSENLLVYPDLYKASNYYINLYKEELPEEEISTFTLRPIVQEVDERANILKSTFTEVFSILPVLITVLISFIGIRKGISFLISQVNKS